MADRLRSTTRARLSMCWSARPDRVDEWGTPIHDNPFRERAHPGERVIPAADSARLLRELMDVRGDLKSMFRAVKEGGFTLSDLAKVSASESPNESRCSSCGKALPRVAFIESDHEVTLQCHCAPQPDALMLILDEVRATRELLQRWDAEGMPATRSVGSQ